MNWIPVLLFMSLYSLCPGRVIVEKRAAAADSSDKDSMFGHIIIEQMLGSDSVGLDTNSYQASNSSDLYRIIGEYIYEIFKDEDGSEDLINEFKTLLDSEDFPAKLRALGDVSKRIESIVTGSLLKTALMEHPQFVEQHTKAALKNIGDSGSATQTDKSPCNGPVPDLGKVNGFYGNPAKLDLQAEVKAVYSNVKISAKVNGRLLTTLDYGFGDQPNAESRLGAYYATRDYKAGSVGRAIHHMIGGLYLFLGSVGEEKIGRLYNDQVVKALLNQPIESGAIRCMAYIEDLYFKNVRNENPESAGAALGSFITPRTRDCLTLLISGVFCS